MNEKGLEIFTALSSPVIIGILSVSMRTIISSGKKALKWIKTKNMNKTPILNSYVDYTMKSTFAMIAAMVISIIVISIIIVTMKIDTNANLLTCIILMCFMLAYLIRYYIKENLRSILGRSVWSHIKYFNSTILYILGVTIGVGFGNNNIGNLITYLAIGSTLACIVSYIKSEAKDKYYKIRLKTFNQNQYELIDIKDIKLEKDRCIILKRDASRKLVSEKIIFNHSIEYIEYLVYSSD